ncbi:dipeptidase PepV [Bacillus altitudinis]|uniref:dipeptidase PepV n=1 Tax=Bacillus altitudinis TaxID=293387 RepID=UPI0003FABA89|nr:dipeptidase PepV [Bacillus altitudinis]MCM3045027.1 dipeptidase PepV [Bacillus altitudinis]MCY7439100.1 dipeptidase PepV [Bacillus altitudinis]MDR4200186.1 dipeptidase PepV [Bacillus altitudinis]MEC1143536.1 dipeptidase PepV [Bacillus altitudinis]MEC1801585.1 dipeptidase PepV [Bacillus altitudinis]
MNWEAEVIRKKDSLIQDTQSFLQIESVLDEEGGTAGKPFGEKVDEALQYMLKKGQDEGFKVKNVDGYAGHIEYGEGEDIVGVLCHVDVVPAGDDWTTPPFSADIRENKIFARGAIDDKGPTMAAFYALKMLKDAGLPLSKKIRIIIGTDEESDWRCVDHYFKHEAMPQIGFAPDADFPIIHAEKGIIDAIVSFTYEQTEENKRYILKQFTSGMRLNMVPDEARAIVAAANDHDVEALKTAFAAYLAENQLTGETNHTADGLTFTLKGVSVHAMEPANGTNAGIHMANFLCAHELDERGLAFTSQINALFDQDTRGQKLGIACKDDISGDLTLNVGTIRYSLNEEAKLGLNVRYPVTADGEEVKKGIERIKGAAIEKFDDSPPHHVSKDHPLVKTLQRVYEEQTGDPAHLIAIGGGTYARSLEAGVAFGPLFPGRPDCAHQKDEYIEIDDLLRATALYAQAMYELAK